MEVTSVSIEFSPAQLQVLNQALQEMPYKLAAPMVSHINSQIEKALGSTGGAPSTTKGA